jgi:hypothetical protein
VLAWGNAKLTRRWCRAVPRAGVGARAHTARLSLLCGGEYLTTQNCVACHHRLQSGRRWKETMRRRLRQRTGTSNGTSPAAESHQPLPLPSSGSTLTIGRAGRRPVTTCLRHGPPRRLRNGERPISAVNRARLSVVVSRFRWALLYYIPPAGFTRSFSTWRARAQPR